MLGNEDALFPLTNPALVSMPLAFGAGIAGGCARQGSLTR
jgi:hypothetical protein